MLLEKLNDKNLFTESQMPITTFIHQNLHEVSQMTIGQLAKATYSSNATIIRICHKLGCEGFKEFKYQLTKELESNKFVKQSVDFTKPFYLSESDFEIINSLGSLYKETIDIINSSLDFKKLEQIVRIIHQSKRVFIYSVGDTSLTVKNFMNKLMKINIYAIEATEYHEEISTSHNVTSDDCVLLVTYRGQTNKFLECLQIVRKSGCKTIIITANQGSLLVKLSDYCLLLPHKENDDRIATFYSQLAFNYILTIIYALLHKKTEL
ncbi:MurR/RpiR family transcriptional regulator [uncultured Thomasclavelia sp.]|uniref:MurR/RpiR family transcriptional regulator n=1 Tax=uncultured Thomasclavelia sp. TaxID=3025759 RepID=UPI0025DA0FE0|nr:MurR/RpiR family transcriptional regulator [uncultured Thomasclavelia sp.]